MSGHPIAFADWWACDEGAARAHAARVVREHGGRLDETLAELGVRYSTALRGTLRRSPWGRFLREEAARARALAMVHRRVPETRVSVDGAMMGWR
jgi:hypothetical protein